MAIKEMLLSKADTAKTLELFEREAKVLERLEHPGIPKYHDDFIIGFGRHTALYLVQDFVTGRTLNEVFDGPTKPSQVYQVCLNVLEILSYLHSFSPPVIHRDIKPQNIIQSDDGKLTLIDFGSVKAAMDRKEGGSTVAGTFGYMPPEQLMGRAVPQSDVYAVGALCIRLLTGQEPESFQNEERKFEYESMSITVDAEQVLARLLNPRVDDRPNAGAAIHLFHELLRGGDPETALVRRTSSVVQPKDPPGGIELLSEMASQTFGAYSWVFSQPGPRTVPDWIVQTHPTTYVSNGPVIIFFSFLTWSLLMFGLIWIQWRIALLPVSFSVLFAFVFCMSVDEGRNDPKILQNGVLTQAHFVAWARSPDQESFRQLNYQYTVGGTVYDGIWVAPLTLSNSPKLRSLPLPYDALKDPTRTPLPVLYLPDQPSKSVLLFAQPWLRGQPKSPIQLRITRDGELLGLFPLAGDMSVGAAKDNNIRLPYLGVDQHHFQLSQRGSCVVPTSTDVRVNNTLIRAGRTIGIGDVIEFAGIRAEVEAVGVRGNE